MKYSFNDVLTCNMCGKPTIDNEILGKRLNQHQGRNPRGKFGITTTVVRCRNCNLIYSNPQPVPESIDDHYDVQPEAYWSEAELASQSEYFSHEISVLREWLPSGLNYTSLDIGAGLGKAMKSLSKSGFDAFGIETSPSFHAAAISRNGIRPDRLQLSSLESAQFEGEMFDFISFGAVLEHLYDPSAALKRAIDWLKPGGILHVEVPSSRWLVSRLGNAYYRLIGTDYVANISPMHAPYHLYEFSRDCFELNGKSGGYELVRCDFLVGQTYLPRCLDFFLIPFMRLTNTGLVMTVWLRKGR